MPIFHMYIPRFWLPRILDKTPKIGEHHQTVETHKLNPASYMIMRNWLKYGGGAARLSLTSLCLGHPLALAVRRTTMEIQSLHSVVKEPIHIC
jgi:hypothetical protein